MKRILLFCFSVVCFSAFAQKGDFKIGFRLAPSTNVATVRDKDATPSDVNYISDGYTIKEKNVSGVGVSFFIDYFLSERVAFSTGLWITQKNFSVRNYDGSTNWGNGYYNGNGYGNGYNKDGYHYDNYPGANYGNNFANGYNYWYSGVSNYKTTYLQIPLLFKYFTKDIVKNLKIYGTFGPTIDFRIGEKLDGPDRAHYWNMANNNPSYAYRDRNGTGRPVKLFNPIDITLYLSAGVNYKIIDKLEVFGGVFFNKGFVNAINPKLTFAEPGQTKVNKGLSLKSFLIGMELGVTYNLK
ncbi:MAG: outer membrane beta-barrel protein [Opitutaceae bacterium]|nr:outer membrane beta-barrel protein [Cytophagales bacterium]